MAIDFFDKPTKTLHFGANISEAAYLFGWAAMLKLVPVNNQDKIIQPTMCGKHGSLPVAAFLKLAITRKDVTIETI